MTGRRVRRRAREEVTHRCIGSVKDDGPTGQTTGQRGSDPSAYRVSITGYYNILQGIKPETTQKNLDIIIIKCTPYEIQQQNCNHHGKVKN